MEKISEEFVSNGQKQYKFSLGKRVASSLSGFVAGVVFASIVWIILFVYYKELFF